MEAVAELVSGGESCARRLEELGRTREPLDPEEVAAIAGVIRSQGRAVRIVPQLLSSGLEMRGGIQEANETMNQTSTRIDRANRTLEEAGNRRRGAFVAGAVASAILTTLVILGFQFLL